MERTKWAQTYNQAARPVLWTLSTTPDQSSCRDGLSAGLLQGQNLYIVAVRERQLRELMKVVDSLFERCQQSVQHTAQYTLRWLRSFYSSRPHRRPFQLVGRHSSFKKYVRVWKRILCALMRLALLQADFPTQLGEAPSIPWSEDLTTLVNQLWESSLLTIVSLDHSTNREDDHEGDGVEKDSGSDSEYIEDEEEDEEKDIEDDEDEGIDGGDTGEDTKNNEERGTQRESHEIIQGYNGSQDLSDQGASIVDQLFELSMVLCMEEFTDGQPQSTMLVYLSGILGFSVNSIGFRRPSLFTGTAAALIYLQRLLFLDYTLPYRSSSYRKLEACPSSDSQSRFRQVHLRYMCVESMSPISEMFGLLTDGCALAQSEGPTIFFRWSDDDQTVSFREHSLHLAQFRQFAKSLIDITQDCGDQLMYQWNPTISTSQLQDEISCQQPGYSFVQDPRNRLQHQYLELLSRTCAPGPKALVQDNRWNLQSVSQYLQLHEQHLANIMLVMHLWCGLPARCSELFGLQIVNGTTRPRGFYLWGEKILYLVRHHKARRSTNHAFFVARFFPASAQSLILQYLIFIRPLVDLLLRKCFDRPSPSELSFVSHPVQASQTTFRQWKTQDLTASLHHMSLHFLQIPLGVQTFRQLVSAIVNQHLRSFSRPFNQYNDRSVQADPDMVWDWLAGHRSAESGRTYGLNGAFPHLLQPRLLHQYEVKSRLWHHFLSLGYHNKDDPRTRLNLNQNPLQETQDRDHSKGY